MKWSTLALCLFITTAFVTTSHSNPTALQSHPVLPIMKKDAEPQVITANLTTPKKGTIKSKNLTRMTIASDDGNEYFALPSPEYEVDELVWHSDPVNGWVTILGHVEE